MPIRIAAAVLLCAFGCYAPQPAKLSTAKAIATQPTEARWVWRAGTDDDGKPWASIAWSTSQPARPCWQPGDCNCDRAVDTGDIQAFTLRLANPAAWREAYPQCQNAPQGP